MTAVERVAVWKSRTHGTLILNDDGRLLEQPGRGSRFTQVHRSATGTQALMYAYEKGYELVGTISPQDFVPPVVPEPERNKTNVATKTPSKQQQYYDSVQQMLADDPNLSAKAAFELVAEQHGVTAGNISTAYYRMKRVVEGELTGADRARMAHSSNRRAVPDELVNILPTLRAGLDAFERVIAWAEARNIELNEREAALEGKEQAVKDRIQKQLADLFA